MFATKSKPAIVPEADSGFDRVSDSTSGSIPESDSESHIKTRPEPELVTDHMLDFLSAMISRVKIYFRFGSLNKTNCFKLNSQKAY